MGHKVYTASGGKRGASASRLALTNFATRDCYAACRAARFCNKRPRRKLRHGDVRGEIATRPRNVALVYRSGRNLFQNKYLRLMGMHPLSDLSFWQGLLPAPSGDSHKRQRFDNVALRSAIPACGAGDWDPSRHVFR